MVNTRFKKGHKINLGRYPSEETLRKRSLALKGHKISEETKKKISLSHLGKHMSEEARRRMSEAKKGKTSLRKGKHWSKESRKKLSEIKKRLYSERQIIPPMKGKHHTEETRRKLSLSHLGIKYPNRRPPLKSGFQGKHHTKEARRRMSLHHKGGMFGKHQSEETRRKLSFANIGKLLSEETKRKMRVSFNNPKYKQIAKERRAKQIFPLKDSKPEIKIQNFLQQLGITFLKHKHIKEIEHSYQCDIFIPSMNLIIECDGNYWHKYPIGREIDHLRTNELIDKGFKVLRLWESDIKKMNLKYFMERIKPFEKV